MTPFAVFFLRQFFLGISKEVEEAALIDGASKTRVFFTLIIPMSAAPITTLAILTYIASWERLLLAADGVLYRQVARADSRLGLQVPDPADRSRLGGADGGNARRRPSHARHLRGVREAHRELHRLQWHQVGSSKETAHANSQALPPPDPDDTDRPGHRGSRGCLRLRGYWRRHRHHLVLAVGLGPAARVPEVRRRDSTRANPT